jgi:adenosylcobinamide-GDP ribazoletransferase
MKDPRVGTYGVLALIIVLGGGFLALRGTSVMHQGQALLLSAIFSRSICIPLLGTLPYLNHAGSRSQGFIPQSFNGWRVLIPLWPLALTPLILPNLTSLLVFFAVFVLLAVLLRSFLQKNLEGLTGDCLGAAIKLTEFSCFFVSCILWADAPR